MVGYNGKLKTLIRILDLPFTSCIILLLLFSHSFAHVWLFAIPVIGVQEEVSACQASLSFTNSWTLLKLLSIELMIPSNHLILCCLLSSSPQSFPASGSFSVNQLFMSGGQNIRASALASIIPMNVQGWFPLRLTGLIFLLSKGFSRVYSSTTVQKHLFFRAQPSL